MTLQLKKWEPAAVSDHSVVLIIGKRGSGKSVILRSIMRAKQHIPMGIICSGTEEGNRAYGGKGGCAPPEFVFPDFNEHALEKLVERQKRLIDANRASSVFVILDDCMYDAAKVMRTKVMRTLLLNGRHFKFFVVITTQYCIDIPPYARGNIDFVVCCREPIISNRQKLFKFFGGVLPDYNQFATLLDQTTSNFEALVINQGSRSNSASDVFSWYRSEFPMPPFRMGSPSFWRAAAALKSKRLMRARARAGAGPRKPPALAGGARGKQPTLSVRKM
jgi:energy-coupling factor transporter ATP-binding protein EcfA2